MLNLAKCLKEVKIVVAGDFHWPKISEKSVSRLEDFLKEEQPDILVLNGDIIDAESAAKFPQHPKTAIKLKEEIDGAKLLLKEFRMILSRSRIIYTEGNHEWRVKQYLIRQAPIFWEFIDFKDMLGLEELKIDFVPTRENATRFVDTFIRIDDWTIGHFDKALKEPGATVRMIAQERGTGNYVQAHTHKLAHIVKRGLREPYHLIEGGCMCELLPSYTSETNWNNGFVFIDKGIPHIILT